MLEFFTFFHLNTLKSIKIMPIGQAVNEPSKIANGGNNSTNKNKSMEFELVRPKYSLNDVILSNKTRQEVNLILSLKRDHEIVFREMGFCETHKKSNKFIVNFYGEPGTGKTITAHAVAKEFGKNLLLVDYSQIESKYVGDTPKNLMEVFRFAEKEKCLIFFDEADAILSKRVTNMQSATDTSVNQTRSVLLNILNDFNGDVIFATNYISNYDSAFMRRISKHVYFDLPDIDARCRLYDKYIPSNQKRYINIPFVAEKSDGLSAADIENCLLMTAFHAASLDERIINTESILCQIDLIMDGKKANINYIKTSN